MKDYDSIKRSQEKKKITIMKHSINFAVVLILGILVVVGCSSPKNSNVTIPNSAPATTLNGSNSSSTNTSQNSVAPASEKPIAIKAADLTKEYDSNELAADKKYKDKMLAVTGKIGNIAETLGTATVMLAGHDFTKDVMCRFDDADKASIEALKKGQTVTLVGKGDGMTMSLYVGLQSCKIQQ